MGSTPPRGRRPAPARLASGHISNVFSKLDLPVTVDDHRRVLAVLAFLRAQG